MAAAPTALELHFRRPSCSLAKWRNYTGKWCLSCLSFVQRPLQDSDDCSAGTFLSGSTPSSGGGARRLSFTRCHTAPDHCQLPQGGVLGEENCSQDCLRPLGKWQGEINLPLLIFLHGWIRTVACRRSSPGSRGGPQTPQHCYGQGARQRSKGGPACDSHIPCPGSIGQNFPPVWTKSLIFGIEHLLTANHPGHWNWTLLQPQLMFPLPLPSPIPL